MVNFICICFLTFLLLGRLGRACATSRPRVGFASADRTTTTAIATASNLDAHT